MQLKLILILVTALSTQWGVSYGEEDSNVREKRHYDYYVNGPGSITAITAYIISALCGLCLCCIPCVVFGIVGCIAICVVGSVENKSRNKSRCYPISDTETESQNYCRLQPYAYPQTVNESLLKAVNENDSVDT